jgi:phage protein D
LADLQHVPVFTVKVGAPGASKKNAKAVPAAFLHDIDEIVVDSSLYRPDMVTIRVNDSEFEWINNKTLFDLGKVLVVEVQPEGETRQAPKTLIEAEITGLEPVFDAQQMSSFLIRGYARSHRLHFGKYSRTFLNQSDANIVRAIANEVGLTPEVDSTPVVYDYVLQNNQTNMEFLAVRADRLGYRVFVSDGKLYFKKGDWATPSPIPELDLNENLIQFRPRISAIHQADKVVVRSWDAKAKVALMGQSEPNGQLNQGGMQTPGGAEVKAKFQAKANTVIVDQPVNSVDEATALAQGLANDLSSSFVDADGLCFGDPRIKAGCKVKVKGLGERFDGPYFVTSATHLYNSANYVVEFTVQGRQPKTLSHLLSTNGGQPYRKIGKIDGVVVGLVTNLNDPERLGRVKVKFPWMVDDSGIEIESTWAKVSSPMAGQDKKGFYYLPEVEDEVLLAFEHVDINRPYVVGTLWNTKDQPPKGNSDVLQNGKVAERIIRSRLGHELVFDDSENKPSVTVTTNGGHKILLDDTTSGPKIELTTAGGHKVILDDSPGKASIQIVDQSGTNSITIDSVGQTVALKAANALRLEAATIILAAQAAIAMSAPGGGTLEADGPISVQSKAAVSIQGPVVRIN